MPAPAALLPDVIALVRAAGDRIAAEFARPGGPRGGGDKAPVDAEIEATLRDGLTQLLPVPVRGEELPDDHSGAAPQLWLMDPHDGTAAFLEGRRGSAVSVALLREGTPVLGVVYAPASPDRGPDLIAPGPRRWTISGGTGQRSGTICAGRRSRPARWCS